MWVSQLSVARGRPGQPVSVVVGTSLSVFGLVARGLGLGTAVLLQSEMAWRVRAAGLGRDESGVLLGGFFLAEGEPRVRDRTLG